jgi:hypothetical protein
VDVLILVYICHDKLYEFLILYFGSFFLLIKAKLFAKLTINIQIRKKKRYNIVNINPKHIT